MKTNSSIKQHIVLIGGGFAGLNLAERLSSSPFYHITLIDKHNYNSFTPLLYQVATGFLEPSSISYPFRKLFRKQNVSFRMGEVTEVDTAANMVHMADGGRIRYDYLVFASGAKTNFFNNENIRRNALVLKGIDDALVMRNHLISVLERASITTDRNEKQTHLTVVIAGAGPTGIELAGMLAEWRDNIVKKEYPELNADAMKLYVVDGAPFVLAPMSDKTHHAAYDILRKLGIEVMLNTFVKDYQNQDVILSNGEVISAATLIWAAGVSANTFKGIAQTSLGKGNRMVTDAFHRVQGYQNVFAIGDISIQQHETEYRNGHPQLAQPAIQQGKSLAKNFIRMAKRQDQKPFKYFDRGEMAIIGRHYALADLFKHKVHFGGLFGLMSWLFIHLISLVSYDNIIKTLYTWIVAYVTRDQALRMIFRTSPQQEINSTVETVKHLPKPEKELAIER